MEGVKPGVLSEELRKALGMGDNTPPPWLINMQRYGPPPSYPNLRIPGLNAPIPPGGAGLAPWQWGCIPPAFLDPQEPHMMLLMAAPRAADHATPASMPPTLVASSPSYCSCRRAVWVPARGLGQAACG